MHACRGKRNQVTRDELRDLAKQAEGKRLAIVIQAEDALQFINELDQKDHVIMVLAKGVRSLGRVGSFSHRYAALVSKSILERAETIFTKVNS